MIDFIILNFLGVIGLYIVVFLICLAIVAIIDSESVSASLKPLSLSPNIFKKQHSIVFGNLVSKQKPHYSPLPDPDLYYSNRDDTVNPHPPPSSSFESTPYNESEDPYPPPRKIMPTWYGGWR